MSSNKYDNSNVIELTEEDIKDGKIIKLGLKGKYGLLKAYAPWCSHCTAMVDDLKFLAEELKRQDVFIAALNCDNNKNTSSEIGVQYFPTIFMVNETGELEKIDMPNRSIESILTIICQKTNDYSKTGSKKKGKCCRVVNKNGKRLIECNK